MPKNRWLTPDHAPADFVCRRILIPNDAAWIATVAGCLNELIYPYNFEQFGAATPTETAGVFAVMFDEFSLNGMCRMIGEIITYAGTTSPDARWRLCDGTSLLRADYPDLFAAIGTTYGAVDGSHFNLPDLQGRSPMGQGTGTGLSPRAPGDSLGEETHTLSTAETPAHTHVDAGHTHGDGSASPTLIAIGAGVPAPSAIPAISVTGVGNASLDSVGSGDAHNNIQPSLVITYLIVALP